VWHRMGWLPFSHASVATDAAASLTNDTAAALSAPTGATQQAVCTKLRHAEQPTALSEAEQLDLLVGGARLDDTEAKDKAAFLGSNKRHMLLDGLLSCAVYTFSGLQHIQGQSNALTLLTMWTVGTTFLVDAGERKYLQEALQGTLSNKQQANSTNAPLPLQQHQQQQKVCSDTVRSTTADESTSAACAVDQTAGAPSRGSAAVSPAMVPVGQDAAKLAELQRKVFMTPTVASWVWMLASFQQFKVHKRLKWCGYSSWMGLGCVAYYTTRHMYNLLVV
jgi:hypothetical protein